MPYHRTTASAAPLDEQLVMDLASELKKTPEEDTLGSVPQLFPASPDTNAPDIQEEVTHRGLRHVRVVWGKWAKLSPEARGRIIVEAYRSSQGESIARQITIAMGLTPNEAQRLGFTGD